MGMGMEKRVRVSSIIESMLLGKRDGGQWVRE
jgi:hypothetical protein